MSCYGNIFSNEIFEFVYDALKDYFYYEISILSEGNSILDGIFIKIKLLDRVGGEDHIYSNCNHEIFLSGLLLQSIRNEDDKKNVANIIKYSLNFLT